MFISSALAQEVGTAVAAQPDMASAFWTNMGLIGLMFLLFYFLMIRPQQKRMKEQRNMLDALKKGDKIVTGGGLYGTVSKIISDTEVEIDLGGTKVTALRYTIQNRLDDDADVPLPKVSETKAAKPAKKSVPAVNKSEKKKAAPKPKAEKTSKTTKKPAAKKTETKKAAPKKTTNKKKAV
jgi:preprotein translocase subunit YajC